VPYFTTVHIDGFGRVDLVVFSCSLFLEMTGHDDTVRCARTTSFRFTSLIRGHARVQGLDGSASMHQRPDDPPSNLRRECLLSLYISSYVGTRCSTIFCFSSSACTWHGSIAFLDVLMGYSLYHDNTMNITIKVDGVTIGLFRICGSGGFRTINGSLEA
jgi:hypothetical protein